ncbi:AEC family transporter [Zafaria sp. Z1313]|uniref:AEC family transporter n=1 Tax=Zafaria sp. Z1313 TaxID=3423202 RepID=UPI003D302983
MDGVLMGFGVVLFIVLAGFAAAALVPSRAAAMQEGMTPAVYYITNPALMLMLMAETDLASVAGVYTPIALATAATAGLAYAVVSRFALRRPAERTAVGAMAASYVNAGNIGLPIALYAVGSAAPVVAVLLAQLLVVAPVYLAVFSWCARRSPEADDAGRGALWGSLARSFANPVTVATAAGVLLSLSGWRLPDVVWTPVQMLGNASIVMLLLIFGMSLRGQAPLSQRSLAADVALATVVKLAVMPLTAWLLARFAFGLDGVELLGVVVMAALPTAQNVFLFSAQFRMPTLLARDVILLSSLLAFPAILLAAFLLS